MSADSQSLLLGQDLLHHILAYNAGDKQTLIHCSLVSRSWAECCRPLLFQHINLILVQDAAPCTRLLQSMRNTPRPFLLTKTLAISTPMPSHQVDLPAITLPILGPILGHLPNLSSLILQNIALQWDPSILAQPYYPSFTLYALILNNVSTNVICLSDLFSLFSEIQNLALNIRGDLEPVALHPPNHPLLVQSLSLRVRDTESDVEAIHALVQSSLDVTTIARYSCKVTLGFETVILFLNSPNLEALTSLCLDLTGMNIDDVASLPWFKLNVLGRPSLKSFHLILLYNFTESWHSVPDSLQSLPGTFITDIALHVVGSASQMGFLTWDSVDHALGSYPRLRTITIILDLIDRMTLDDENTFEQVKSKIERQWVVKRDSLRVLRLEEWQRERGYEV